MRRSNFYKIVKRSNCNEFRNDLPGVRCMSRYFRPVRAVACAIFVVAGIVAAASASAATLEVPKYRLVISLLPDTHQIRVSGTMVIPPAPTDYAHLRLKLSTLMHEFEVEQDVAPASGKFLSTSVVPIPESKGVYDITLPRKIHSGEAAHVRFSYLGGEKPGFVFSLEGPTYYASGSNTAWYPQLQDNSRGTGDLIFKGPPFLIVAASGIRVERRGAAASFHVPVPMHLSFVAAKYHVTRLPGPIPVTGYTLKARPNIRSYLAQVQRLVTGLAREFGRYPYPEISLAEVPRHQANNTGFDGASVEGLVLLSDYSLDDRFSVAFFGHELSHQWWGNSITVQGVQGDGMLDEGMAQFGSLQMVRLLKGRDAAERFRRDGDPSLSANQSAKGYLEMAAAGLDHPLDSLPQDTFVSHELANSKGALVLDQLARTIGRRRFSLALHDLTQRDAFKSIPWSEFLTAVQRRASRSMDWFYAQWFTRIGAPDIQLKWHQEASGVTLELRQFSPSYKVRVPVQIELASGSEQTVYVDLESALTRVQLPNIIATSVILDRHYEVLRWTPQLHEEADALAPITRAYFLRTDGKSKEAADAYNAILDRVPAADDPWGLRFRARRGLASIAIGDDKWADVRTQLTAALAEPNAPPAELPWAFQSLASAAKALDDRELMRWAIAHAVAADRQLAYPTGAGRAAQALLD